jgi:hypothetical protein
VDESTQQAHSYVFIEETSLRIPKRDHESAAFRAAFTLPG